MSEASKDNVVAELLKQLNKTDKTGEASKAADKKLLKDAASRKKWSEYPPLGQVIEGTRFICFKVPMDKVLPTNPDHGVFTSNQLFKEHIPGRGRSLGMVVDLNDTYKFYNPYEAFESRQVKHYKLFCPAGDELPHPRKLLLFSNAVTKFTTETEGTKDINGEDVLVGVHCINGVDRTAYFICYYMITQMNRQPADAIKAFEIARGFTIESSEVKAAIMQMKVAKAQVFKKKGPAKKGSSKNKKKK